MFPKMERSHLAIQGQVGCCRHPDHLRLGLQSQAEAGFDGVHHMLGDSPQLTTGGMAVVDQDQGMAGGNAGIAITVALEAGGLYQPGRPV